ncbi:unnamed protein product [Musa acuminata subsp. malaccensis]|uniref:Uncharacterized protein n=1 Tax=Musa acuminata subsp. malaccensis TaxID=214687 RepID=A0A804U5N3_MUSAM|nr:unnamed protein product [Musa acuminata subsp. malaccensis]
MLLIKGHYLNATAGTCEEIHHEEWGMIHFCVLAKALRMSGIDHIHTQVQ